MEQVHGGGKGETLNVNPLRNSLTTLVLSNSVSIEQPPPHNHKHPRSLERDIDIATLQQRSKPLADPSLHLTLLLETI